MSATSGITVSPELSAAFSDAVTSRSIRFLKISIRNESLVADESVPPSGTLGEDLDKLGDLLEDDLPAYVLVRLDEPQTDWLAVFYVPETAKVRDKMLYASTRNSLTKALGSAPFKDTLFATSKADISATAYAKHRASLDAPKPMSAREKEMEEIKQAEGRSSTYEGSRARVNHVTQEVGLGWPEDIESAVLELGSEGGNKLVVITIDPTTEVLQLHSVDEVTPDNVGSTLLASDPCYAFFAWTQPARRDIVFIYSCPSSSSVKHRMLYSCGTVAVGRHVNKLLEGSLTKPLSRRIETSDPKEINEAFLQTELESALGASATQTSSGTATPVREDKPFAKPRGPARKR